MTLDDLMDDKTPRFSRLTSHEPKEGYNWEPYKFHEGGHYVEGDALFRARIAAASAVRFIDPGEAVLTETGYGLDAIGALKYVNLPREGVEPDDIYRTRLISRMARGY